MTDVIIISQGFKPITLPPCKKSAVLKAENLLKSNHVLEIIKMVLKGAGAGPTVVGKMKKSVLFICLGNICRSPMAEAVFAHLIQQKGLEGEWAWDSAALGPWHVGKGPERRTMKVLQDKKVEYSHRARQIKSDDFTKFDYIFGMDDDNISELERRAPKSSNAKIELLGSYDPEGEVQIRDPYYDDDDKGFYKCYEQCLRSCTAFIDSVK